MGVMKGVDESGVSAGEDRKVITGVGEESGSMALDKN
jgi:hypothetical protein